MNHSDPLHSLHLFSLQKVKKKIYLGRSFSNFLATHKPSSYNVEVSSEIDTIKEKFASKSVMVNKKKLFKAMSVERGIDVNEKMQMPQTGKDLLSNPFFPK